VSAHGETVAKAYAAAHQLARGGRVPSVHAIRQVLGGLGGAEQITKGQQRWLEEVTRKLSFAGIPEPVVALFAELWEQAKIHATEAWMAERTALEKQLVGADARIAKLKAALAEAKETAEEKDARITEHKETLLDAHDEIARLGGEITERDARITDLGTEITAQHAALTAGEERIRILEAEKEREIGRGEAARRRIEDSLGEIAALQGALREERGRSAALSQEGTDLHTALKAAHGRIGGLEAALGERDRQLAQLTNGLEHERVSRDADTTHWLTRLEELQVQIGEYRSRERMLMEDKAELNLTVRRLRAALRTPPAPDSDTGNTLSTTDPAGPKERS
jgi:chromosome segregation ATPase